MRRRHILGLDLGQRRDPTAIALVERVPAGEPEKPSDRSACYWGIQDIYSEMHRSAQERKARAARDIFQVRLLERFPLGTGYPDIVAEVAELTGAVVLEGPCQVVVDGTGVGAPVVDLLRRALGERFGSTRGLSQVVFTGGHTVSSEGNRFLVPRNDLVSNVEILLESGRLLIALDLSLAGALGEELENVHRRVLPPTGKESFIPWRENCHDDLVFALAVALWWGQHTGGPQ